MATYQIRRCAAGRSPFLNRSALSGALGVLLCAPAAQANPVGPSVPSGVAHAPTVSTSGATTTVTLNQSRTIIDWSSFTVAKGETLNFDFAGKGGVVLNRTAGAASVNGALNGCVVTCNVIGGSVWIYAPQGVLFGPSARVNVGSLLATTTPVSNLGDFLAGGTAVNFGLGAPTGAVTAASGARLTAQGGALALIAPQVDVQPGASLTAAGTVLLAAAQTFRIHFDESAGGDLDLLDFEVPTSALQDGSVSATPLSVNGQVAGGSVVLAAVSRPSVLNAVISIGGVVTAKGAEAGTGGDILLTASGAASTTQVSGVLSASRAVSLQAPDAGALEVTGRVTARDAVGQGGAITLGGTGTGSVVLASGAALDASSLRPGQTGGRIDATAAALEVDGTARATGPAGGGSIRLGGGARGEDAGLADATTTTIGPAALVDASATTLGDGGQVVVWSNAGTRFLGAIRAQGGPHGGDGGDAEVSGGRLQFAGAVDLSAARGRTGSLLLDPTNVEVTTTGADSSDGVTDTTSNPATLSNYSTLTQATINTTLQNANVEVEASGQIRFDASAYSFTGSSKGSALTFSAAGAGASDGLGFEFNVATGMSAAGAKTSLASTGLALNLTTPVGFDLQGATISTGGGALALQGSALALGGSLLAGAGQVTLTSTAGGVSQPTTGVIQAGLLSVGATASATTAAAVSLQGSANHVAQFAASVGSPTPLVSPQSDIALTDAAPSLTIASQVSTFLGNVTLSNTAGPLALQALVAPTAGVNGGGSASLTSGGALSETGQGAVQASSLSLHATSGDISFTGANAVGTLASLAADGAGASAAFNNTQALTVSPTLDITGDLTLSAGGTLTLSHAPTVDGAYSVQATGFGGSALTPSLAANSNFTVTEVGGGFDLASLGPTIQGGAASSGLLTVTAAQGAVTDGAASALTFGAWSVSGKSVSAGALTAAAGAISLASTQAPAAGGDAILLSGALTASQGSVTLTGVGGPITQVSAGAIASPRLSVDAGTGSVSLAAASNDVAELVKLTGAGVSFTDATTSLTVDAAAGGSGATTLRNSGDLLLDASPTGASLALTSDTGSVTATTALVLPGDTTVSAHVAAVFEGAVDGAHALSVTAPAITFDSTVGASTPLSSLTATGVSTLMKAVRAAGDLQFGGVTLAPSGSALLQLTSMNGNVNLGAVSPATGATNVQLSVSAANGSFSAGVLGSGAALAGLGVSAQSASFAAGNDVGVLALSLTSAGSASPLQFDNGANALTIGTVNGLSGVGAAQNLTLLSAALSIGQAVDVGSKSLTLTTSGAVTETAAAGVITAGSLSVSADGAVTLDQANAVSALTGLDTAGGDGHLVSSRALQVSGTIDAHAGTLGLQAASLALGAATLTGSTIDLVATSGGITQGAGGVIAAATLTGQAAGDAALTAAGNAVTDLGSYSLTAPGRFSLTNGQALTVTGAVAGSGAAGDAIVLQAPSLTLASTASVNAATVSLTSTSGAVADTQGSVITTGALTGDAATSLTLSSTANAVTGVQTLTAHDGAITLVSGSDLVASGLVSGAGVSLTAAGLSTEAVTSGADISLATSGGGALTLTGIVSANGGAGRVSLATTVPAPTAAGAISETGAGAVQAATLDLAGGAITLLGANQVAALGDGLTASGALQVADGRTLTVGSVTHLGGPVSFTVSANPASGDTGALTFTSAFTAPSNVTLTAAGVLTLPASSIGGDYAVKAAGFGGGALRPGLGSASNFSVEQTGGDLDLAAFGSQLTVGGRLSIVLDDGSLTDTGAATPPTLTVGSIVANGRNLAFAGLTLTGTGAGATGATLQATQAIELDGAVSAPGAAVVLSAGSSISEAGAGAVTAVSLDAEATSGAVQLGGANAVRTLTDLSGGTSATYVGASSTPLAVTIAKAAGGPLSITAAGEMDLVGIVDAGGSTATLTARGLLTQTSAAPITAGQLVATGGAGVSLGAAANAVDQAQLSGTGSAGVVFADARTSPVAVAATSQGGSVQLSASGDLQLLGGSAGASFSATTPGLLQVAGAVGAQTSLSLVSTGGRVGEAADGGLSAASLSATGALGVDLTAGTNTAAAIQSLKDTGAGDTGGVAYVGTATGALLVQDVDGAGGAARLANTGGLSLGGAVRAGAGQLLTLDGGAGSILQTAGQISADHLAARAGGAVQLTAAGDAVGAVDSLSAGAGAQLEDHVAGLTVTQASSGAGDLRIDNSGAITLAGTVAAGGAGDSQPITLNALGGPLSELPGGLVSAASLSATGAGGVTLAQANPVSVLTLISDTGSSGAGVSFAASGPLTVLSALGGAGGVTLSAGGALLISGTGISALGHTVELTAASVAQDAGGVVVAGVLTGSATSGFTLTAATNAVGRIQAVSDGVEIALQDSVPLQVSGVIAAPKVALFDPGSTLTQDPSSVIQAGVLSASAAGGLSLTGANSLGELLSLVNAGAGGIAVTNASAALTAVNLDAGAGDLTLHTAGSLALSGALAAGSAGGLQTASLIAGGAITQASGSRLTAGRLTGSAGGDLVLASPTNAFATLGALTAEGAASLADSAALTVAGAVQAGAALQLASPGLAVTTGGSLAGQSIAVASAGPIQLAGAVTAPGLVSLTASAGGLGQSGGAISAGSFQAAAVGGISLPSLSTAQIVSLTNTGAGDIFVQLAPGAVTSGPVSDLVGAVTIAQGQGSLSFTAPVEAGGALSLSASGALSGVQALSDGAAASLSGASVDFSAGGTGRVAAASAVSVAAATGAALFQDLSSGGGDVVVLAPAGEIGVGGQLVVGRDLVLTGASFGGQALSPMFGANGRDFLLTDTAGGLAFTSLHAPRNLVVAVSDPGPGDSAPLSGGALLSDTGSITATATDLSLSGPVSAPTGGVKLTATAGAIALSGLLDAGTSGAMLAASGAVTETGAGRITAGVLDVTAGEGIVLQGANAAPTVSLANGGGGGVAFSDTAPSLLVQQVFTVAGDLSILTQGSLTIPGDLTSPGGLSLLAGGPLSGAGLDARGGTLDVSAQGLSLSGPAVGAAGVQLIAGSGPATLGPATATAGDLLVTGGDIATADLQAGGGVDVLGAGAVTLVQVQAGGGPLTLKGMGGLRFTSASTPAGAVLASGGALDFTALDAGDDASVTAAGALTAVRIASSGGNVSATAAQLQLSTLSAAQTAGVVTTSGPLSLNALAAGGAATLASAADLLVQQATVGAAFTATAAGALTLPTAVAGSASLSGTSVSLGTLATAGAASATSTVGDLTLATLQSGGDARLQAAGSLTLQGLSSGTGATLLAGGDLSAGALQVGGDLQVAAMGAVTVGSLASGPGGDLSLSGATLQIGAASGAPGPSQRLATGPATTVELAATRAIVLDVQGGVRLTRVDAGGDIALSATGGDLSVGALDGGGALAVTVAGGSAALGAIALTGAGPAAVSASEDVTLGSAAAHAGAVVALSIPDGLLTINAGRNVAISYADALSLASVQAGGDVSIASTGGALTLPSLSAGGSVSLSATALSLGQVSTGASFSGQASVGDAVMDAATVGGDLSLTAAAGSAVLHSVEMTGALAGGRTLQVQAADDATLGRSVGGGAAGVLRLDAAERTQVFVSSTGTGGGTARVDVGGDAELAGVSSVSGDVVVDAAGQVIGVPGNGALFAAGRDLTLDAGAGAQLGGQSYVTGAATLTVDGALTLNALTAGRATVTADDLTLTGLLKATQACSPLCAAPTLVIASRGGALTVGDVPAGGRLVSGGMTLDAGEVGRLQADSVALYAGDPAGTARGDLQVGDLRLDAGSLKALALYAGPQATVTVTGVVQPAAAGTGVLTIGAADATSGWTPRSIYVEGQLGASGPGLTSPGTALSSVELNSIQDTLIGGETFVSAVSAAEGKAGDAINITRGVPVGVQPDLAVLNHNLITTGVLTLRSNGYVVQENTGGVGQQGGILLTNPAHSAYVLTLGQVAKPAAGVTAPVLIDLSASYVNQTGALIERQVAATADSIDLGGLTRSNAYRINGCTIAVAGSCTPLPSTIVDVRIDKLVEGVQLSTEDPPPLDDPTITATGNDEIWRSGPCGDKQDCR